MVEQTEAFKKAIVDSKKLTSKPSSDELLAMYGKSEARAREHPFAIRHARRTTVHS